MVSEKRVLISAIFILRVRKTSRAFAENLAEAKMTTGRTVKETRASFQLRTSNTVAIPTSRKQSLKTREMTEVNNSCIF